MQEYWSRLPFSPPGDLPELGIKPVSPAVSPAMAGGFFTSEPPGKPNPIISWEIDGKTVETLPTLFWGAPKSLQMVTAAMKLKYTCFLEEKL